jgi:N-acetylglutamate synthase-like GNAT family acetyltransferase
MSKDRFFGESKSENSVRVRKFKKEDLNQVKNLIDRTINTNYSHYPTEFIDYWKNNLHSKTSILRDSVSGFILVAILNEKIVGTGTLVDDEISRVFVDPLYQRKGLGKLVMTTLEKEAMKNGVDEIRLTSTAVSKQFYDALGFSTLEGKVFSKENSQKIGYFQMSKNVSGEC